ncbi:MAG: hypothetical protein HY076_05750 [Candidatus Eisenbacteria bacterium]|uniref:Uncharacterized protein n=1 Tax=Eiseniibacteriota bacterium TaxID=2212470 RepID=A0A9D6L6E1_UNCEI|nr:hypothetical protein [Candidatus Eisenbacteria bacterium]MBI3539758.1 hypothetical protein [Candidatus Eisenbacteria bacterium]
MTVPAAARAQSLLFDYVGFDYEYPKFGPTFGSIGNGYQGVGEVQVVAAPLVSDQTNYQYTYFFDGLTASNVQTSGSFVIITYSGPGTLTVYEDSRSTGTAFDYGTNPPNAVAPPSFIDGTAILVGSLTNFRYVFNTSTGSGSFDADFSATGGTQLSNLPTNQRDGWTFAGVTQNSNTIPTGYAHQVKGQTFLNPPLPTQNTSWGGLKRRYR